MPARSLPRVASRIWPGSVSSMNCTRGSMSSANRTGLCMVPLLSYHCESAAPPRACRLDPTAWPAPAQQACCTLAHVLERRLTLVACVLAMLLVMAGAVTSPVRAEPPRFSVVAPGIAHAAFKVRPADTEPFSGHAFTIDLEVAQLRL